MLIHKEINQIMVSLRDEDPRTYKSGLVHANRVRLEMCSLRRNTSFGIAHGETRRVSALLKLLLVLLMDTSIWYCPALYTSFYAKHVFLENWKFVQKYLIARCSTI